MRGIKFFLRGNYGEVNTSQSIFGKKILMHFYLSLTSRLIFGGFLPLALFLPLISLFYLPFLFFTSQFFFSLNLSFTSRLFSFFLSSNSSFTSHYYLSLTSQLPLNFTSDLFAIYLRLTSHPIFDFFSGFEPSTRLPLTYL